MFRRTSLIVPLLITLLAACSQTPTPEADAPADLAPAFGTSSWDEVFGLARHDLGVYAVGSTQGKLDGTNQGKADVFIRKYDVNGNVLWRKQFGTSEWDGANDVASDSSHNAYVVGETRGSLAGSNKGYFDAFIRKYDPGGGHVWTRQFGTSSLDSAKAVAVSGKSVYVVAELAYKPLLYKYTTDGTLVWRWHLNPTFVTANDVGVDGSGNIYVVGTTYVNDPDRTDQFIHTAMVIRKFSPGGGILWTRQVSFYNYNRGMAMAVRGSHVYLVGEYLWDNDPNDTNVLVIKYTTDGGRVWSKAYGAYGQDYVRDASVDSDGNLYFAGITNTSFAGPNQGHYDGYVMKLSHSGDWTPLWSKTIGTSKQERTNAVLVRTNSQVYAAGHTFGDLDDGNRGSADAFVRRLRGSSGDTVWTR
jgi:hypothetical protein